jgi:hypothetical protein
MLSHFDQSFPAARGFSFYDITSLKPAVATLIIFGLLLTTSVGTIFASQNTLPGQKLYTVKRLTENIRLIFAFDKTEKNVLRAELLSARVEEARVLARRVQAAPDFKTEQNLATAVKDIKNGVDVLQKEILSQSSAPEPVKFDITADEGSLPVQDGKKMAQMILSEGLQKTLEETKDSLAKKDLTSALAKTIEVNEKLTGQEANLGTENNKLSAPALPTAPFEQKAAQTVNPIESKAKGPASPVLSDDKQSGESGSIGSISVPPAQKSDDFKISPTRDSDIKTDIIRER